MRNRLLYPGTSLKTLILKPTTTIYLVNVAGNRFLEYGRVIFVLPGCYIGFSF